MHEHEVARQRHSATPSVYVTLHIHIGPGAMHDIARQGHRIMHIGPAHHMQHTGILVQPTTCSWHTGILVPHAPLTDHDDSIPSLKLEGQGKGHDARVPGPN